MGGRGGGGYITNTHTGYITFWRQWRSAGKSRTSRQLSFPFLALILPFLVYLNDFNPSSSAPVRGCTLEHEKRRVVSRLVSSECLKNCPFFEFELHINQFPPPDGLLCFFVCRLFLVVFPSQGDAEASSPDFRGTIFSHFQKQKKLDERLFCVDSKNKSDEILSRGFSFSFFSFSFFFKLLYFLMTFRLTTDSRSEQFPRNFSSRDFQSF